MRAVALEGSVGRNGGSITIANATLVQDVEICRGDGRGMGLETTTASATGGVIRDEEWFTNHDKFYSKAYGVFMEKYSAKR